jgi:cyclic pyranopterin phosphate synthase
LPETAKPPVTWKGVSLKPAARVSPVKNFSSAKNLTDPFGRKLDYLRLSLTERCNLRCTYCMPPQGIPLKAKDNILSFEEMDRLVQLFLNLGMKKIRITGGEPFVRKGAFEFIQSISQYELLKSLNITTNAVLIEKYLPGLKKLKLDSLNISLDSLNRERFKKITLRDNFDIVYKNIFKALDLGISVKINVVVMPGVNDMELKDFVRLTKEHSLQIRFIEEMPFNGADFDDKNMTSRQIMEILDKEFLLQEQDPVVNATARIFKIPGYQGSVGIIEGFTRTFCSTCNRLRITAEGVFKTCLYDRTALNFKQLIREGATDSDLIRAIKNAVLHRAKDGFESQKRANTRYNLSMAQIGG